MLAGQLAALRLALLGAQMRSVMKVTLVQMNSVGDKAANLTTARALIERAIELERPDWICLPECFDFIGGTRAEKIAVLGDMQVVTLTSAIRQERGIQAERGALIYALGQSAAEATGLETGDVILQINRRRIENAEELRQAFTEEAGQAPVTVWFERGGMTGRTTFYVQ